MRDVVEIEKNQDGATISYARYERMHQFDFNQLINTLDEYNIIFQHIKNGFQIVASIIYSSQIIKVLFLI